MPIKEIIKAKAYELGFSDIGFANFEVLDYEIEKYKEWLANKYNASMEYLERNVDKRCDISLLLDNAKTVIVTATNYFQEKQYSNDDKKGKIARYALGDDYHTVIKNLQKELINQIKQYYPKANFLNYIDTGPILERQWAVRSGVGWQGKNGNVISKKIGSWFFIGIIITDIEFEPGKRMRDYCGTCTKCIEECPTDAIVSPKVVDANKCISYWTIEAKPDLKIPDEITEANPNWMFGCDICQEVCPWNKKHEQAIILKDFLARNNENEIDLKEILNMTKEDYAIRFKNSAIKRAKLESLQRNANSILKKKIK